MWYNTDASFVFVAKIALPVIGDISNRSCHNIDNTEDCA